MPKKQGGKKKAKHEVEEIEESYNSEDDDAPINYDKTSDIEVDDVKNLGNYESASSDDEGMGGNSSDDSGNFQKELSRQKEEAISLNQTWGRKTQNFYGRNKESDEDSDSDDDQDE